MVLMQLPQWLARFNRHVTNPIQRMWAGWVPTMGILEHVGRKSGKPFRTPLTVFSTDDGVAILLTYGPNRDWLKNITAAGDNAAAVHGPSARNHFPCRTRAIEQGNRRPAHHVDPLNRRTPVPRLPTRRSQQPRTADLHSARALRPFNLSIPRTDTCPDRALGDRGE